MLHRESLTFLLIVYFLESTCINKHTPWLIRFLNRGPINTPLFQANAPVAAQNQIISALAVKRLGQPEEVAEMISWLLSDSSSYVTGTVQVIDGGWLS